MPSLQTNTTDRSIHPSYAAPFQQVSEKELLLYDGMGQVLMKKGSDYQRVGRCVNNCVQVIVIEFRIVILTEKHD